PDLYRRLLLQPRGSAHPLVTAPSTTALAPLSLHDALPIFASTTENPYFYIYNALLSRCTVFEFKSLTAQDVEQGVRSAVARLSRSEEHTSELQSRFDLVCRLLREKKKRNKNSPGRATRAPH